MPTVFGEALLSWFLYFSAMSFGGWVLESAYRSVQERRWVNSGFLSGPFVPIYGFGAVAVAFFSRTLRFTHESVYWLTLALTPTALEYAASWLLEKAFGLRLWDYKAEPFNLRGRVCLQFAVFWAALTVLTVLWAEPYLFGRIASIDPDARWFLAGALSMYFLMDTVGSSRSLINFTAFLADLKELAAKGGAFLPSLDLGARRLPREIRRLVKPLKAFPHLVRELKPTLHAVPDWITAKLETLVGGRHFRR